MDNKTFVNLYVIYVMISCESCLTYGNCLKENSLVHHRQIKDPVEKKFSIFFALCCVFLLIYGKLANYKI